MRRSLVLVSCLGVGMLFSVVFVADVLAALTSCPSGFNLSASGVCLPTSTSTGLGDDSVFDVLANLMNWLLGIIGVLAVVAFVISGIQYFLAAGDEKMAETAKRNITYAIIGLAVALSGLIIVNAVAGLTGAGSVYWY